MSHFARLAAVALVLAACSSSKPPNARDAESPVTPEPAVAPADPAVPAPASDEPETPSSAAEGASEAPSTATLFVRDRLGDCRAEGARQCLQIRGSEAEQWRNFYGAIDGFEYAPSYAYELLVKVVKVANPPADAASIRYELVEVVSKKKAGP
jgi:hypothetical protein